MLLGAAKILQEHRDELKSSKSSAKHCTKSPKSPSSSLRKSELHLRPNPNRAAISFNLLHHQPPHLALTSATVTLSSPHRRRTSILQPLSHLRIPLRLAVSGSTGNDLLRHWWRLARSFLVKEWSSYSIFWFVFGADW
ncbi:hypothetical protein Droror1_Dr00011473 [Drosera rotundifolia]